MQNLRKHVRVPIRAQITCITKMCTFRGITRNLSEGGIQVEIPDLERRAEVHLMFRLPTSDTIIDTFGAVVWESERKQGIEFKHIGTQSSDSIRHFVEQRTLRIR